MAIRVRATRTGVYGVVRYREGQEFEIANEKDFSKKWMEKVDPLATDEDTANKRTRSGEIPEPGTKVSTPVDPTPELTPPNPDEDEGDGKDDSDHPGRTRHPPRRHK